MDIIAFYFIVVNYALRKFPSLPGCSDIFYVLSNFFRRIPSISPGGDICGGKIRQIGLRTNINALK